MNLVSLLFYAAVMTVIASVFVIVGAAVAYAFAVTIDFIVSSISWLIGRKNK